MISEGTTEIADFIYSLKKQIEDKRFENDRLRKRVQESLQQTGQPYHKEMEACVKASINATVWQRQLTATERMSAVKDDIALPIKTQKYAVANDKNCERKNLLTTLQIGLNVLNLGGGLACVEFVVHAMRIVTNYNTKTEQFLCKLWLINKSLVIIN